MTVLAALLRRTVVCFVKLQAGLLNTAEQEA